jgi:hypothetical protein
MLSFLPCKLVHLDGLLVLSEFVFVLSQFPLSFEYARKILNLAIYLEADMVAACRNLLRHTNIRELEALRCEWKAFKDHQGEGSARAGVNHAQTPLIRDGWRSGDYWEFIIQEQHHLRRFIKMEGV